MFCALALLLLSATTHNTVPDVRGLPLGKAMAEISTAGFNMKLTAPFQDGDVVGEQVPMQGTQQKFDGFVVVAPAKAVPAQAPAAAPAPPVPAPEPKPAPKEAAAGDDVTLRGVDKTKAYTLEFAADGRPVLTPTNIVTPNGPGPTPTPTPTPVPPPTDLTARAKAIQAEAIKVGDPATAKDLAEVYRQVAKLGVNAKDAATLQSMAKFATDTTLGPIKAPAWQKTRDVLATQWFQMPAGSIVADYCTLLNEAATGLDAVDTKGISPEMKKWILEVLIPLLIKLFLTM